MKTSEATASEFTDKIMSAMSSDAGNNRETVYGLVLGYTTKLQLDEAFECIRDVAYDKLVKKNDDQDKHVKWMRSLNWENIE